MEEENIFEVIRNAMVSGSLGAAEEPELAEQNVEKEGAVGAKVESGEDRTTCGLCGKKFEDVTAQRAHFKGDWHRYNLKRKAAGKKILTEDEAEITLLAEIEYDGESLSGSAESSGSSSEEDEIDEEDEDNGTFLKQANSMFVGLKIERIDRPQEIAWSPRAVVLDPKMQDLEIESLRKSDKWIVLLHGAGHFAGLVIEKGSKIIDSKSFHRYVVRKKQGKAQSSNDQSNGKAKSAGAQIRRYNEKMLKEEIGELLNRWEPHVADCSRIFMAVSRTNQHIFFQNESLLTSKDPRIRRVPFVTRRPTVKEAQSVAKRLSLVRVQSLASFEEDQLKRKSAEALAKLPPKVIAPPPPAPTKKKKEEAQVEEIFEDDAETVEFLDACRTGAMDVLIMQIALNHDLVKTRSMIDGSNGLHVACAAGKHEVVQFLLENGADPTQRDFRKKLPFHQASTKECKEVMRRFWGDNPDKWDYSLSGMPSPISEESEALKKEKNKLKKKMAAERKKQAKAEELALREAEERRKAEEEAALEAAMHACEMCRKKLTGKSSDWFHQRSFYYCSTACMNQHRRELMASAAASRLGKS